MLAKNEKNLYFDAHFHFFDCVSDNCARFLTNQTGCSSFLSQDEWASAPNFNISLLPTGYTPPISAFSYGIHPMHVSGKNIEEELSFIDNLIQEKSINAVGECGFDFFTKELKETEALQIKAFEGQLDLALKNNLPLVIHCRKANDKLFEYASELKKLPGVLFHSFMGSPVEAQGLIDRGINAWFSFGKQLFNGNKKVIGCVKNLPLANLLLETDAPFQILKGEIHTLPCDIEQIYEEAYRLRSEENVTFDGFCDGLEENFHKLFNSAR